MLDELEQRLLRPVEVLEDDDERGPSRKLLEESSNGPERLLRRADRVRAADGCFDARGDELGLVVWEEIGDRGPWLVTESLPDDLGDRPERDSFAVWEAATRNRPSIAVEPGDDLLGEARLADAGGAEDGEEIRPTLRCRSLERVPHLRELELSADELDVEPSLLSERIGQDF